MAVLQTRNVPVMERVSKGARMLTLSEDQSPRLITELNNWSDGQISICLRHLLGDTPRVYHP
jgi:hypothetical protein